MLAPVGAAQVKVSFLAPVRFGRASVPQPTQDHVISVASLQDLLAKKLKVILQRAEAKDYLDIAAILMIGEHLAHGLAGASALFGLTFQPSESLKALTFFGEGDLETLPSHIKRQLISAASAVDALPEVKVISPLLGL
ncbi:MAG: nucleotidyl transferase AbiEii/AbiGii toxin family protein [Asticcacaulis sp.]